MKRILVIEDDPVVGTVYQRFLQGQGFVTELAKDGVTGLEKVITFEPDAVLLDMMMPKMGGADVLKKLRAQPSYRELPVIVFTNAAIPAFVEQATQAGANHVFDKAKASPSGIVALLQRILQIGPHSPVVAAS
ncbi:MAG TPA: response regulator [Candidatus Acidoferrum sp.]|nr:response regulator [Candidatus Acidoferrum sp.]